MNYTTNYNLRKPEPADPVNVEDLNENMEFIDSALANLIVPLWQNASPTGTFMAQTISLDLAKYPVLLIKFRGQSGGGSYKNALFYSLAFKDDASFVLGIPGYDKGIAWRSVTVSDTEITFSNASYAAVSVTSNYYALMVPDTIYGIGGF